jgi:hypothetical protein
MRDTSTLRFLRSLCLRLRGCRYERDERFTNGALHGVAKQLEQPKALGCFLIYRQARLPIINYPVRSVTKIAYRTPRDPNVALEIT